MTSYKTDVNGWPIWCQIYGTGSKALLMIPGALGTGTIEFYDQVYGDDALDLNELTIVCVELPGWGRSRPPLRKYGPDVYKNDAQCCYELMKSLGYDKYSVLGWCHGTRVALMLSHLYPSAIESMILCAVNGEESEEEINKFVSELTENVNNWNQKVMNNFLRVYEDINEIQNLWSQFVNFISESPRYFQKGLLNIENFDSINCPVLITHGDKDHIIPWNICLAVFKKLKNAEIQRFQNGGHNLHRKYKREFKQIVEKFLLKK